MLSFIFFLITLVVKRSNKNVFVFIWPFDLVNQIVHGNKLSTERCGSIVTETVRIRVSIIVDTSKELNFDIYSKHRIR